MTRQTAPVSDARARRIEYVALDQVAQAARNPKGHDLAGIQRSIARFGFVAPAVMDERTARLVAGNGRTAALRAMRDEGQSPPAGVQLDTDGGWLVPLLTGWSSRSDAEAEAYLVADNQWTVVGGWDNAGLAQLLDDISTVDKELLELTGFSEDELVAMLNEAEVSAEPGDEDDELSKGGMLALAGTAVGEPSYTPKKGDAWQLGDTYTLVVADPHREWHLWTPLLIGDMVLLPYPSPLSALTEQPAGRRGLLVQPSTYLAGWVMTMWARGTGGEPQRVAL